jgi:hypothetical protein
MNEIITLKCWNRPIYLLRVLNNLSKCRGIEKYPLLISCDKSEPVNQQQILDAINYSGINEKTKVSLVFQQNQLGCAGNTRFLLERSWENGAEYCIHLEDDTVPGIDCLEYFEQAVKILDKENLFAACTFNRPVHQLEKPGFFEDNDLDASEEVGYVRAKHWFDGAGGFAMTATQWKRILEMGGMFGVNWISEKGRTFNCQGEDWLKEIRKSDSLSWVWPFHKYFSEGKKTLYPEVGRVLNIGQIGLHANAEIHGKIQYNPWWINHPDYIHYAEEDMIYFNVDNIIKDDSKYVEYGIEK